MKKAITFLCFVLCGFFARSQSYITADTDIILKEGGILVIETGAHIFVKGTYEVFSDTWLCSLKFSTGSGIVPIPDVTFRITGASVDAQDGMVTDTDEIQRVLELTVIEYYLEVINPGTIFTRVP